MVGHECNEELPPFVMAQTSSSYTTGGLSSESLRADSFGSVVDMVKTEGDWQNRATDFGQTKKPFCLFSDARRA